MTDDIDCLCSALLEEFGRDPRGTRVAGILGEHVFRGRASWRAWAVFDDAGYTRNLVHRCGAFELLLLAWDVGQESPIHDHAGQQCWMAVVEGSVEEVHFRAERAGEPLERGSVRTFSAGQVAYIDDQIALHLVRPTAGRRAVSLHLYSDPIDSCRVYDPSTGRASRLEVGYHSVRGELCGAKSAESVRAEWS